MWINPLSSDVTSDDSICVIKFPFEKIRRERVKYATDLLSTP